MQKTTRLALLAAATLALPAAARAQTTPAAPAAPAPAPAAPAAPADEATQLRQRLGALQQQAMQDPALKPAQDSFSTVVNAAMVRLDPAQAPVKIARAAVINSEIEAAQAAHDNTRLTALATEAPALQSYLASLRTRANADPAVQAARQVWLTRLLEKMKTIDPNTQQYVDRLTQLSQGGAAH